MANRNTQGKGIRVCLCNCQHGSRTFAAAMIIILLTVLDSYFTLDLVSRGAEELNPVMAYYLERGPLTFFAVKYLLTWASLTVILTFEEAKFFGIRVQRKSLLWLFMIALSLVVQWELLMLHFPFE